MKLTEKDREIRKLRRLVKMFVDGCDSMYIKVGGIRPRLEMKELRKALTMAEYVLAREKR